MSSWRYRVAVLAALTLPVAAQAALRLGAWRWSRDLPAEVNTAVLPANRTAKALEPVFKRGPLVRDILAHLGRPDGFSRQSTHSRNKGTADDAPSGGTLRFLLANDEELHVWTGDLIHVHHALRWSRGGKATLVFK